MVKLTRRQFTALSCSSALALHGMPIAAAATAGRADYTVPFDPAIHVNPELRDIVPMLQQWSKGPPLSASTLPTSRKMQPDIPPLAEPSWSERLITGTAGAPDVRIYVINVSPDQPPRPALLHMHGGGFIFGSAKGSLHMLQELASALNCIIVSVEYRLAPETRFAGSMEDNYAGLKWLYHNAAELGVDPKKIAVFGESAGGGHAAILAIAARDRGEVPVMFQALVYPMLDDRTGSSRAAPPYIGQLIWTAERNQFAWTAFLGTPAGSVRVPYGPVPARVDDLRGLPRTFIGVGSIDLFADEDIEYARRLILSGVQTELMVVPGAFHGFQTAVPNAPISKQFNSALNTALLNAWRET